MNVMVGILGLGLLAALTGAAPDGGVDVPRGRLDKEIVRRIIRRHINEVKACYERELIERPMLGGRVMVQFTIGTTGQVIASVLQNSTLGSDRGETCIVQAVRRWEFPKPIGGGDVIVSYPFVLTPEPVLILGTSVGPGSVQIAYVDSTLFVHRSYDARGAVSNGIVALTKQGLVLVDAPWTEEQTGAILRWGLSRLGRPWAGAVVTHDHADRAGALAALVRGGVRVAALDLTAAKLARRGVPNVGTLLKAEDVFVGDARGFEVFYPGAGRAPDNIVVAFPAHGLVFGGGLVRSADAADLGPTAGADLAAWPAAVRRVAARYPHLGVVPGQGSLENKDALYDHTLGLLAKARP
jgi:glyoxylase-like metal-dependent hydrolase (beta-lactamase superfamily II)